MSRMRYYDRGASRGRDRGGSGASYRDAVDLEDAAHAINNINARKHREDREQRRGAITLPGGAALAAWLKKDVP